MDLKSFMAGRESGINEIMSDSSTNFILLKSKVGTFDVTMSGLTNPVWEYNSTKISGNNGVFTILQDGDFVKLSWGSAVNTALTVNTNGRTSVAFDLSELYGKITSILYCGATSCTGDIATLQGKITTTLYCGNTAIYGDLATLGGKIGYALSCGGSNVFGVYSPTVAVPVQTNLSVTQISTSDMDSTLIVYATKATELSKSNGTFTATGMTRTAASDDAVTTLVNLGWTVSGLTKVVA